MNEQKKYEVIKGLAEQSNPNKAGLSARRAVRRFLLWGYEGFWGKDATQRLWDDNANFLKYLVFHDHFFKIYDIS